MVTPILLMRTWSPRELSKSLTRSEQYMMPSEFEPRFHWLEPHTFNYYKMIRTSVQKLSVFAIQKKRMRQ